MKLIKQNALGNLYADEEGYLLEVDISDDYKLGKIVSLTLIILPMLAIIFAATSELDLTNVKVETVKLMLFGIMGFGLLGLIMAMIGEKTAKVEFLFFDQYMEYFTKSLISSESIHIEYNDIEGFLITKIGDSNIKMPIIHTRHRDYRIKTIMGEEKCKLLINTIKKASKKMRKREREEN